MKLGILAKKSTPQLRLLATLPKTVTVVTGETVQELNSELANLDALLVWNGGRGEVEEILGSAPKLKWIHCRYAGVDSLLSPALIASPVTLTNARGVYARSLAEFVIAGMMYFAKDFPRMLRNKEKKNWEQFPVEELNKKTVVIFGYGEIGKAIAERAKPFGMEVIALRRTPELSQGDKAVDEVYPTAAKQDVCGRADFFVVAAPLTADTKHAIGEREFSLMKSSCVFINVGRGPVVDEKALTAALSDKKIRAAVLDVFESEPLSTVSPLWELDNVFLSPHTADQTATWLDESMAFFIQNCARFVRGEQLRNVVQKDLGY